MLEELRSGRRTRSKRFRAQRERGRARDAGAAPVRTIVRPTVSHTPLPAESEADERTNDKKGQIQGGKDYFDRWDKFAKDEVSKVEADDEREAREAAERLAGKRKDAAARGQSRFCGRRGARRARSPPRSLRPRR